MKINTDVLVEDGGGLLVNLGLSYQVGNNMRWNGNPQKPEDDSVFKDRRLYIGLLGEAVAATQDGWLGSLGRMAGEGALNSLVTTEVLRYRLTSDPNKAAAQLPPGQQQQQQEPKQQNQGDYAGFYGNARPW